MIINGKRYKDLQAYKEKGKQSYLYTFGEVYICAAGYASIDAYAGLTESDRLPKCHTTVSTDWLYECARPISFKQLPDDVKQHLTEYVAEF